MKKRFRPYNDLKWHYVFTHDDVKFGSLKRGKRVVAGPGVAERDGKIICKAVNKG